MAFGNLRQLKSRRWQARYTHKGVTYKAPETYALKSDAQFWLDSEHRLIEFGEWTPPEHREKAEADAQAQNDLTVRVHMNRWLTEKARECKPSTMAKYRDRVERRITGEGVPGDLADMPVHLVTAKDARQWWEAITTRWPNSSEMNRKAYQALRSAFADLVDDEVLPANPIGVKAAKRRVKPTYDKDLLTTEELTALYKAASERYRVITALVYFHGLRIGEALALKGRNVLIERDSDGAVTAVAVRVEDNLQRIDGKMVSMGTTKTAAGVRTVPVFEAFWPDVLAHLDRYKPGPDDLLTTTKGGSPVMDTSYRSTVNAMAERAGITKRANPHAGRRYITTTLLEQGVEPSTVGAIIGDSDLTTVLEIYAQVRPDRVSAVMAEAGKAIRL
ncbi:tyrosine-type recombinase/integrase [Corynebacterium sp. UBA2622]|uniref:tyrosine-type recombinase/integrase n=1 Tax=Corynebacterium sp. UBA2622 TaxID=1946393 RepID=UPI0025BB3B42|nr:tyrosine-type recombinase/integrase [Corynebacterium sp. UBA2622]